MKSARFLDVQGTTDALKGAVFVKFLDIKRNDKLVKTHDLVVLARELKAPKNIKELCRKLTPSYQYTRYPDIIKIEDLSKKINNFLEDTEEIIS